MREYNSETDYHIIEETVRNANGDWFKMGLTDIAAALRAAGIEWPKNYNSNPSAVAIQLGKDICRAWGK
jgi:exonuclease I